MRMRKKLRMTEREDDGEGRMTERGGNRGKAVC
jgi:hypothetical protein